MPQLLQVAFTNNKEPMGNHKSFKSQILDHTHQRFWIQTFLISSLVLIQKNTYHVVSHEIPITFIRKAYSYAVSSQWPWRPPSPKWPPFIFVFRMTPLEQLEQVLSRTLATHLAASQTPTLRMVVTFKCHPSKFMCKCACVCKCRWRCKLKKLPIWANGCNVSYIHIKEIQNMCMQRFIQVWNCRWRRYELRICLES